MWEGIFWAEFSCQVIDITVIKMWPPCNNYCWFSSDNIIEKYKYYFYEENVLNSSVDKQEQTELTPKDSSEYLEESKAKNKSAKSNSELMAEFFSVNSDVDKK
mgnify:FL=1